MRILPTTAIAEGDPAMAGPFTMMLKLRDGGWIAPHCHDVDRRLVVITGTLLMGHGDTIDEAAAARRSWPSSPTDRSPPR